MFFLAEALRGGAEDGDLIGTGFQGALKTFILGTNAA